MRLPREVEVDWSRAVAGRVPILGERCRFDFHEPAVAAQGDRRLRGVIGWDPAIGWVLVPDPAPRGEGPTADGR